RRRRRGKDAAGGILVGLVLMTIGGVGSFFGRLIRSGVSRQREYLADAAAVQFTRNPQGVAGALLKIGGYGFGSHLANPRRTEVSHMFFGSGLPSWDLSDLFGTHPPIEARVARIDPSFEGEIRSVPLDFVARWADEEEAPRRAAEE